VLSVNSRRQKVHSFFSWVINCVFRDFKETKSSQIFYLGDLCSQWFSRRKSPQIFSVFSVGWMCFQLAGFDCFSWVLLWVSLLVASSSWWTLTPSFLLNYVIVWCWVSLEISSMYFHAHEKINSLKNVGLKNFFWFSSSLSLSTLYVCACLEIWFKVLKLFQLLRALLQAISFFLLGLSQASWASHIFKGQRVCLGEGGRRSKRICGVSCAWWKTKDIEFGEREKQSWKTQGFLFLQLVAYSWLRKRKDLDFWERESRSRDTNRAGKLKDFVSATTTHGLEKARTLIFGRERETNRAGKVKDFSLSISYS
jgi:hypothetical protein